MLCTGLRMVALVLLASMVLFNVAAAGNASLERTRMRELSVKVASFGGTEPVSVRAVYEQNEDWLKDFSLEVQNTSGRPIYYIEYGLMLTNPQDGTPYLFYLSQGRKELLVPTRPALPSDRAIQPGETITLRIPASSLHSFESYLKLKMVSASSFTQARLAIQSINFGDGTGWQGGQLRTRQTEQQQSDAFTYNATAQVSNEAASSCGFTYRRIQSGPAECLQCDAPSLALMGPGNERAVPGRVVCTDESGRTITCFGYMVYPCNI